MEEQGERRDGILKEIGVFNSLPLMLPLPLPLPLPLSLSLSFSPSSSPSPPLSLSLPLALLSHIVSRNSFPPTVSFLSLWSFWTLGTREGGGKGRGRREKEEGEREEGGR